MDIKLTLSQEELHDNIVSTYKASGRGNPKKVLVTGSAGTGKSTSVFKALETIIEEKPFVKITFLAPTHNALSVVRRIGDEWTKLGSCVEFSTVASSLHLRPKRMGVKTKFVPSKESDWRSDIYLIDEVSQIGQELLDFILEASENVPLVIFLGDKCQLPPVSDVGGDSEEESPIFTLEEIDSSSNLTEIMRYSGDVLKVADAIRLVMDTGYVKLLDIIPDESESIEKIHVGSIKEEYAKTIATGEYTKVLAFRNDTVNAVNDRIHSYLGHTEFFVEGSRVVNLKPILLGNKIINIETPLTIKEIDVHNTTLQVFSSKLADIEIEYTQLKVTYNGDSQEAVFNALSEKQAEKFNAEMKKIVARCKQDGSLWRAFYEITDNYIPCRLPYATTIHKSQGDTYDKVILMFPDLAYCRNFLTYNKLLYTAFTRTRGKVLIATA